MTIIFYIASIIAIFSTIMVITRLNAVHALLYLIVSLLSVAVIFFVIGAPFIAALEVIIYAGAIMVLFIFVVMMLNLGGESVEQEKKWLNPGMWIGPGILALVLLIEFVIILTSGQITAVNGFEISPKQVGISLFTTYLLGVEFAAIMLMAGIVGAYHLGRKKKKLKHRFIEEDSE